MGSTNEETMAPLATPPESNAIPVNSLGVKIISTSAAAYPGSKSHITLKPRTIRSMENPSAAHTPIHKPFFIVEAETAPADMCSTCLLSTYTAGSAETTKYPKSIPTGTSSQPFQKPASALPISRPTGMNPTFAPVKKNVSPANVYTSPIITFMS